MSRRRSFIKNLTTVEKELLEREKKHGKSDNYRKRCHAILLSNRGYTIDEIMGFLEVSRASVSSWFSAWKKSGIEGLKTKPGQGRRPKLNIDNTEHVEGVKKAAKQAVKDGENLLAKIQNELELEEPITKRMLTLFLEKLVGSGNAAEKA